MTDEVMQKSILILAANPLDCGHLRLQEEVREINRVLRLAGYGKVPIQSHGATRVADIQQQILDADPQIVHFCGHGAGDDGLAFEDDTGRAKLVETDALAELFRLVSDRVECVVLNACSTNPQAEAIARYVDCVIGTKHSIGDQASIKFAVGFYTAIGNGKRPDVAFEWGCNAIQLEGIPEYLTPVLHRRPAAPLGILLVSDAHYYENTPFLQRLSAAHSREVQQVAVRRYVGDCAEYRTQKEINVVFVDPASPTANSFGEAQEFIDSVQSDFQHVHVIVICGTGDTIRDFIAATGDKYRRFVTLDYQRATDSANDELRETIVRCEREHRHKHARSRAF